LELVEADYFLSRTGLHLARIVILSTFVERAFLRDRSRPTGTTFGLSSIELPEEDSNGESERI
jgi:hypothetical protein